MKSPRMLLQRRRRKQGHGYASEDESEEESSTTDLQSRRAKGFHEKLKSIPSRRATKTDSTSSYGDEDENPTRSSDEEKSVDENDTILEEDNSDEGASNDVEEVNEDVDDGDDDEASCYSGAGSEYSGDPESEELTRRKGRNKSRVLQAFNLRRVFSQRRKNRNLSDGEYDGSVSTPAESCSYESSFYSEDLETVEDEEAEEAVAAAEALRHDLEEMGYDLDCESFITKGSSDDASEERYVPPSKKKKKRKKKKDKELKKKLENLDEADEATPLDMEEKSLNMEPDREEKDLLTSRSGSIGRKSSEAKASTKSKPKYESKETSSGNSIEHDDKVEIVKSKSKSKKKGRSKKEERQAPSERDAEDPEHEVNVRDRVDEAEDDASIGSLSNPSDVLDRSLKTNTSSKLKGPKIGPATSKYGRPMSPVNMESLASLRELVEITKKHKKTIPPPTMIRQEKSKARNTKGTRKEEHEKEDEVSIAAMSGVDQPERRGKTTVEKQVQMHEEKDSLRKAGSRNSPPPIESAHTPVIIEGMSVLLGRSDSLASELPRQRREGMPQYKHLAPDPPEEEQDVNKIALSEQQPSRPIQTKQTTPALQTRQHTTALQARQPTPNTYTTALSSPDAYNRGGSLTTAPHQPVQRERKRFFGLNVGRRAQIQEPRVPHLPQTPRLVESQRPNPVVKKPVTPKPTEHSKEPTGKKFQLPAPILTKEDPVGAHVREPPPFKLPTSMKESMMAPSKDRGFEDDDCPFPIPDGIGMEKSPMAKIRALSSPVEEPMKILPASPATVRLGGIVQAARNTLSPRKSKGVDRFFATVGSRECEEETLAPGQIEVTFDNSVAGSDLVPVAKLDPPPPRKWQLPISPRSLARLPPPPPPPPPPPSAPLPAPATSHLPSEAHAPAAKARNPLRRLFRMPGAQSDNAHMENVDQAPAEMETKQVEHKPSKSKQIQAIAAEIIAAPRESSLPPLDRGTRSLEHQGTFCDNIYSERDGVKSTFESTFDSSLLNDERNKNRVMDNVNLYLSRGKEDEPQEVETKQPIARQSSELPKSNASTSLKQEDLERTRSEPLTQTDRLSATVKDIVTAVFSPELLVEPPPVAPSRGRSKGLLNDWFNLDLLGNLDWATRNNEGSTQSKHLVPSNTAGREAVVAAKDEDETGLETNSIIDRSMHSTSLQQTQVPSPSQLLVDSRLLQIVHGQKPADEPKQVPTQPTVAAKDPPPTNLPSNKPDPIDTRESRRTRVPHIPEPTRMTVEPSVRAEIAEVKPIPPASSLETVVEGRPMDAKPAKGLFKRLRSYNKHRHQEDKMSTGISSSEPSSFYPVEFNDDNDFRAAKPRPSLGSGPSMSLASGTQRQSRPSFEAPRRHRVPSIPESPYATQHTSSLAKSKATPRSDIAIDRSRMSQIPHSPTLSTYPGGGDPSYSLQDGIMTKSFLASDQSSSVDTWAEIADASMVVERAMERLDTFRSDDTEDPAKLKYLLSVVSDDDTIGDVEKALNVLKKHASRLGVKETDLLMAVGSHETPCLSLAETDTRSFKSLTLGEELLSVFNMFLKPHHHEKRQKKSARRHYHL